MRSLLFDLAHRHEPPINYIDHVQRKDNDPVILPAVSLPPTLCPSHHTLSRGAFSVSLHHTTRYHLSLSLYLDLYFEIISTFCRLRSLNRRHAHYVLLLFIFYARRIIGFHLQARELTKSNMHLHFLK
jgi:hypothetical protein